MLIVFGLFVFFYLVSKCSRDRKSKAQLELTGKKQAVDPFESLEYKMATISEGFVTIDNITVTRFRYLLSELDRKSVQNKEEICDMLVTGMNTLENKSGLEYNLLKLTEGVNKYIKGNRRVDFAVKYTDFIQLLK